MAVYLCFLIPVLTVLVLFLFFRHKTLWWEFTIPIGASVLFILIAKAICIHSLTSDTEWLGGCVTEVRYYEPWNEYIHRTCSRSCGKNCRTYYDCSYVQYHSEYWEAITTLGTFTISHDRYDELRNRFHAAPVFKEMNRPYYTKDGDMYHCDWKGEDETLEPVVVDESYENRPKAAKSIFNFEEVDSADLHNYTPAKYPKIYNQFHQDVIIGYNDPVAEHKLQVLNSRLGASKQVHVFVVVFKNKDRQAGRIQERYWEGGNKNEFVITIGIDSDNNVKWVYDFSWTEVEQAKVDVRTFVEDQKKLNLSAVVDFAYQEINSKWIRRDFHKFDYLTIQPTITQVVWIFILTIIVNAGMAVWIVKNEFEEEGEEIDKKVNKKYRRRYFD